MNDKAKGIDDVRIKGKKVTEYSLDELSELTEEELEDVAGGGWSISVAGNINANGQVTAPDHMLDIQRIDTNGQVDIHTTAQVRTSLKNRWRR